MAHTVLLVDAFLCHHLILTKIRPRRRTLSRIVKSGPSAVVVVISVAGLPLPLQCPFPSATGGDAMRQGTAVTVEEEHLETGTPSVVEHPVAS